ncbi:hypothetical protein ACH79_19950 [Bradyrhizobium sp. CCBAU 051011]|uniref:hypothetical protein n=1 Tax=Bradyrhizobium sp. CCBAU 051011 TaxID=858422 RepID=UPI0013740128|nr:hypothetical protein [Bradyrhizobium sp. CCBAU 051011]QHO74581.1 hypothetical protein ACH79_19950 [Bradyrhizobium sp. CCBAU 051011]
MKIDETRFRAILNGTADQLSGQEILIRHVAYEAERKGEDPKRAVEESLPFVVFTTAAQEKRSRKTDATKPPPTATALDGKSHLISPKVRNNSPIKAVAADIGRFINSGAILIILFALALVQAIIPPLFPILVAAVFLYGGAYLIFMIYFAVYETLRRR